MLGNEKREKLKERENGTVQEPGSCRRAEQNSQRAARAGRDEQPDRHSRGCPERPMGSSGLGAFLKADMACHQESSPHPSPFLCILAVFCLCFFIFLYLSHTTFVSPGCSCSLTESTPCTGGAELLYCRVKERIWIHAANFSPVLSVLHSFSCLVPLLSVTLSFFLVFCLAW